MIRNRRGAPILLASSAALTLVAVRTAVPQDRLAETPRYERYAKLRGEIPRAVKRGPSGVTWKDDVSFEYGLEGKTFRYDLRTMSATEVAAVASRQEHHHGERGRQLDVAVSPDGKLRAVFRDRNLWIGPAGSADLTAITTDGDEKARTKNGTGSWVYGEELGQTTAIWWSPKSDRVAYYRFDESKVPDYFLTLDETKLQSRIFAEPYPKAGVSNPVVDVFVYDTATRQSTKMDVRDGKPFADEVVGHYVYRVGWTPDGSELTFQRANRLQKVTELAACDPASGRSRCVVHEEWPASWVDPSPPMQYLHDGRRFLWTSERTGFRNIDLYDLTGRRLAAVTNHAFEVGDIVRVDEEAGAVFYTARDGDNPMKLQLHRVALDGTGDRRLTDPAFHHTVSVSPDGKHFVDTSETHDHAPVTRLMAGDGTPVAEIGRADTTAFEKLGLKPVELFTFTAADGTTELHGMLQFPSDFSPEKKYPLLVNVYAGPATNGAHETFATPSPLTELGFLVASLDSRSAGGRGKRFLDAIYRHLGIVEVDDQTAGVLALRRRPYVDRDRVGIFGVSYGGYASAMALARYPGVFQAACAASPVTDWRHYDTIYTERYMGLPDDNKSGYDQGSVLTYAATLRGRLLLYYGTADDNVHPSNTMQLVQALQKAGKSFDLQVGPDRGHSALNQDRMMEFFIDNLVLRPPVAKTFR
jgi:dipeptidyl-peptidase-4